MKVKRSVEFDLEERNELLINAAKAEAEKHLGKLANDEQFDVFVNSWNIEVTVSKKPEPVPADEPAAPEPGPRPEPARMTTTNAPF